MTQIARKDFGIIESMLILIIALIGWVLIWLNSMDKLYVGMDARVEYLEAQNARGDRFTAKDGTILKLDIQHNREELIEHMKRVEPKIERMYEHIIIGNGDHG